MKNKGFLAASMLIFMLTGFQWAFGQNGVAIAASTATADPSAMLDVQSTTKGALVPRMTNAQRAAISLPANALLVFCTDAPSGYYYNSGTSSAPVWVILSAGALTGTGTTNYDAMWTSAGTLGNGLIYNSGTSIGIGTTSPQGTIGFPNGGQSIAWGAGPYTKLYDNGNIHYWTDDVTDYESAATGTGAQWYWIAGQSTTGTGGTTWMTLTNNTLTLAGLASSQTNLVTASSTGVLGVISGCPSGYTVYNNGNTRLCMLTISTSYEWNDAQNYCNTQSGGDLCTYMQVTKACAAGFLLTSTYNGYWLSDHSGDDNFIYDNGTTGTNNCSVDAGSNFDGSRGRTSTGGAFCCIEFATH